MGVVDIVLVGTVCVGCMDTVMQQLIHFAQQVYSEKKKINCDL